MKLSDEDIYNFISCAGDLSKLSSDLINHIKGSDGKITSAELRKLHGSFANVLYSTWLIVDELLDEDLIKNNIDKIKK